MPAPNKAVEQAPTPTLDGRQIYSDNCARCHGDKGEGDKKGIPLISGHAIMHTEAEYISQVENGKKGKMPAFKDKLSADEIAAVVTYIRTVLQANVTPEQRMHHHS
jgi:cytochrome c oxidase cbb3-type subunit 3